MGKWKYTEKVIKKFKKEIKKSGKKVKTCESKIMIINPNDIIAINDTYDIDTISNDYKSKKLRKSIEKDGWKNDSPDIYTFDLLMLPNGDLLANGNGNHRAYLSKELKIKTPVKANVARIEYY